jgi:hypothetical protein
MYMGMYTQGEHHPSDTTPAALTHWLSRLEWFGYPHVTKFDQIGDASNQLRDADLVGIAREMKLARKGVFIRMT